MLGACHSAPPASFPAPSTPARDSTPRRPFYRPLPYGSESQFSPLSVVLNDAFGQLRTSPRTDITRYPFGASFKAVARSVIQPDRSIRNYGYGQWLRNEIFPLSLKANGGGQWYPNYTLHLFGGGVTYMKLVDWFADHGVESHPRIAAGLMTYAYHFVNEAIENGPTADKGVDALSDLLVFDSGAMILWNATSFPELFGRRVETNVWYGQASVGIPGRTIENSSSLVMVRTAIPRTDDWRLMVTHGLALTVGVSRRVGSDGWLTLGSGADARATPVIDTVTGKKTASLAPNLALFYDRNGSLLASLITRGGSNNGLTLNVYPGPIHIGRIRPSLWVQQNKGGGVRFGLSSQLGIGVSTFAGIRH